MFLSVVNSVQAAEPVHLKPVALFGRLGRAALVEYVLCVNYPYAALRTILHRLKVSEEVDSALVRIETEANKNINKNINTLYWDDQLGFFFYYLSTPKDNTRKKPLVLPCSQS